MHIGSKRRIRVETMEASREAIERRIWKRKR
jgi:hypothetical protein